MFYFYSSRDRTSSDTSFSGSYGTRDGRYGLILPSPIRLDGFGSLPNRDLERLDSFYGQTAGIESAGSTYVSFVAPQGSRVYSPTTSLIEWARSQDAVKRALGLDSGVFGLQTNPDLTRYDAVAALASSDEATSREGARVATANLRAMAVAAAYERFNASALDHVLSLPAYRPVGEYIGVRNGVFVFTNEEMSRLLRTSAAAVRYRDDVVSAVAHLINAYAAAIGVQVSDREGAARFLLGIRGYLVHQIDALLNANSEAAARAALAVTAPQILDSTARYAEVLPFQSTGFFFAGSDFYAVPAGGQLVVGTIPPWTAATALLTSNDLYAGPGPNASGIGFFPNGQARVLSVSVPTANAGQVTATLRPDSTVLVAAVPGFTGLTYFDYLARHPSGEEATGRAYVSVGF